MFGDHGVRDRQIIADGDGRPMIARRFGSSEPPHARDRGLPRPRSRLTGRLGVLRSVLFILVILALPRLALAAGDDGYRLNPGDVLDISVWKEEGMQREVMVLPDGKISFPLAGHVMAAGKTVLMLERILAARLKKFYPNTVISVAVKSVIGNKIFVIGEVNNPGAYQVAHRIDVMQVLSLAGGLTQFAEKVGIKVLRRADGKQNAIPFDYSRVQRGRDLPTNILLQSGDIVIVPKQELF